MLVLLLSLWHLSWSNTSMPCKLHNCSATCLFVVQKTTDMKAPEEDTSLPPVAASRVCNSCWVAITTERETRPPPRQIWPAAGAGQPRPGAVAEGLEGVEESRGNTEDGIYFNSAGIWHLPDLDKL